MASVTPGSKTDTLLKFLNSRIVVTKHHLQIKGHSLSDELALLELGQLCNPTLDRDRVLDAIVKMKRNRRMGVDAFEESIDDVLSSRASQATRTQEWRFHYPFFVQLDSLLPFRFRFPDQVVRVSSKRMIERETDRRVFDAQRIHDSDPFIDTRRFPEYFISTSVEASNLDEAFSTSYSYTSHFKAIAEIALSWNTRYIVSTSARAKVALPSWVMICDPSGNVRFNRLRVPVSDNKHMPKIDRNTKAQMGFWESLFSQEFDNNDIRRVIVDTVRLYSRALDQVTDGDCFVGFWQVLEAATIASHFNGDTRKVVKHSAWHTRRFKDLPFDFDQTLLSFADKRNDLVHRGIDHVTENDISILKFWCELAISWLVRIRRRLPTVQHLEDFYNTRNYDEGRRKSFSKVLLDSDAIVKG